MSSKRSCTKEQKYDTFNQEIEAEADEIAGKLIEDEDEEEVGDVSLQMIES